MITFSGRGGSSCQGCSRSADLFRGLVLLLFTYLESPVIRLCPSPSASVQSRLGAIPEEDDSVKSKEKYQSLRSLFDTCQRGLQQAALRSSMPLSLNVSRIKAAVNMASGAAVSVCSCWKTQTMTES
mmetsp:Transcript_51824/g.108289  ORF Transcript_51824/g.108289 Transcript_51824/m.108289 type:complete len:127 (+) Transcript_51824:1274-1654(+)